MVLRSRRTQNARLRLEGSGMGWGSYLPVCLHSGYRQGFDAMTNDLETAVAAVDAFVQRWESRIGTGAQTGDTIYCVTVNGFDGEAELRASDLRLILSANREMRAALERLASSEAFDLPQAIDGPLAEEIRMRLDYARSALTTQRRDGE